METNTATQQLTSPQQQQASIADAPTDDVSSLLQLLGSTDQRLMDVVSLRQQTVSPQDPSLYDAAMCKGDEVVETEALKATLFNDVTSPAVGLISTVNGVSAVMAQQQQPMESSQLQCLSLASQPHQVTSSAFQEQQQQQLQQQLQLALQQNQQLKSQELDFGSMSSSFKGSLSDLLQGVDAIDMPGDLGAQETAEVMRQLEQLPQPQQPQQKDGGRPGFNMATNCAAPVSSHIYQPVDAGTSHTQLSLLGDNQVVVPTFGQQQQYAPSLGFDFQQPASAVDRPPPLAAGSNNGGGARFVLAPDDDDFDMMDTENMIEILHFEEM